MGYLRLVGQLPVVVYSWELIFAYKYLHEFKAKIGKTLHEV